MRTRTSVMAGVLLLALAGTIGAASAATGDLPATGHLDPAAGASAAADDTDEPEPDLIVAEGSPRLPFARLADWAGYADHVVVATASNETEGTPSAVAAAAGEGYIGRSVRMTVSKTLWTQKSDGSWSRPPTSFTLDVAGWSFSGATRREIVIDGAPRVETGHTYLIPITRKADSLSWEPIAAQAILPYDRGVIGSGEAKGVTAGEEIPAQRALESKDETALSATLASAQPDALVAKYASLDPDARWEKVAAELTALDPIPEEDTADHGEDEVNVDPWNGAEDNVEEDPDDVND
ncbi:hypothetical protein [Nonomuraea sp. NPDC049695]|uniref:hypothetical protein n=1 Tax=Nonomuraea sp. NPDC049695 TaxID=3154734 RepID=UPI00343639DE